MAIAYTKIKGQGAIESGYLKRIGSEDGYTSYQFYRVEAPYKEVQQGLFEQNEDTGEPLNVKLFIKDGVNLADISFNLRSMPGDNSKGYFKDSPHSLNLYVEEQAKSIEMDFSTAIIRKDGAVVEIHTNKGFTYDNRQDGDLYIDIEGEPIFNVLFIKGNRNVSLEIGSGVEVKNFYCTMNSNVSLFVDKSVNDLRFTSIAHKDEKSKDHFVFGIGQNGDVASFDGSSENKTLENVHVRNVKLLARGHDNDVERTYHIGIESSNIAFGDVALLCSYPEKLLNVINNKASIALDICNYRSGGEIKFKGTEVYLGNSIYFDSVRVWAGTDSPAFRAPKLFIRSSNNPSNINFIKANKVSFGYNNEVIIENAYVNIDEGKGNLSTIYEKNSIVNSKIVVKNVEDFAFSLCKISNSSLFLESRSVLPRFTLVKANINNTKLVGCKFTDDITFNIKVTPKDKYDVIDKPLIELTNCDLIGVDEFNLELKGLEPDKIKQCGFVIENSNFNSKNVEITSYGHAKSKLSNIIFEKDFKILSINRNGEDGSTYEITNMILDDKVSFSAKGKANIENSVIENLIVTSNRDLVLKNSTIKRSNISGYTEISDVFVLDEVKKGSGKDRILLPISPEDKAKEVGEVNVEDVEIL